MFWIRLGSLFLFLAVGLGAFGAHGLRDMLSADARAVYQTAVLYHLVHGLGLIAIGIVTLLKPGAPMLRQAGWALTIGIVLFSGSLYVLSVTGVKKLGLITPFGGAAFLLGWAWLAVALK